jgi:hypothetical protein
METTTRIVNGSRVKELVGLRPFYPEIEGGNAWVDASIAPMIRVLNDLGCETWVSCSGLPEDHPSKKFRYGPDHAYIGFTLSLPKNVAAALNRCGFTLRKMFDSRNDTAYMYYDRTADECGVPMSAENCRANWLRLSYELELLSVTKR